MLAVPVALPLAALRLLSVTVTRELVELITVRESLDTTNVLPSDKVRVAVTVLTVGRLMGDAAATLLECAIFAALKLSVRPGAEVCNLVGDCVVSELAGSTWKVSAGTLMKTPFSLMLNTLNKPAC